MAKIVTGVYAAVGTPRLDDGRFDEDSFCASIDFLLERGIGGFAVNGATGEYCLTSEEELSRMLRLASRVASRGGRIVCGIGSAGLHGCIRAGRAAIQGGAAALLLPMPHFFPYEQEDLETFCCGAARELPAPILLYNLPAFTTPLAAETVEKLIGSYNIVGIKDSAGSPAILRSLRRSLPDSCRIVGNDAVLAAALRERLCDGVISGVAGVLPELLAAVFQQGSNSDAARLLDEFISATSGFPTPWALKWIGECRGIAKASFSQPLSETRRRQAEGLQSWFNHWWPNQALPLLTHSPKAD